MSWLGKWKNQFGSLVEVTSEADGRIEGTFRTALKDSGFFGETVPIVGSAQRQLHRLLLGGVFADRRSCRFVHGVDAPRQNGDGLVRGLGSGAHGRKGGRSSPTHGNQLVASSLHQLRHLRMRVNPPQSFEGLSRSAMAFISSSDSLAAIGAITSPFKMNNWRMTGQHGSDHRPTLSTPLSSSTGLPMRSRRTPRVE